MAHVSAALFAATYKILLLSLLLLVFVVTCEAKVPAIIVFGDSSVDPGNNNQVPTMARSDFAPYGRDLPGGRPTGRFCNGKLVPDFISEAIGLKQLVPAYLDPGYTIADFATGVSFASAGTGYDTATSNVLAVIPLWREVEYYKEFQQRLRDYLGEEKANVIISEALYMTSIGTNDFLENYYTLPQRRTQFTVEQYQDYLVRIAEDFLRQLYGLGARKFSFGGLPPMGCLPLERATNVQGQQDCNEEYNSVAWDFNAKLYELVDRLNVQLPGLKMALGNPFYILQELVLYPQDHGFEVTNRGCCGTGQYEMGYVCNQSPVTCPDASKYVFWDSFHPTERTNQLVADHLVKNYLVELLH
ncbi:hypothetical protein Droror1_Dr00022888 [Drosera rotundifolia]